MDMILLDVAIGLVAVFALVSLMCTAIQEMLAGLLNLRGKTLWEGVQSLLRLSDGGSAGAGAKLEAAMKEHPLIAGQSADAFWPLDLFRWMAGSRVSAGSKKKSTPSYLSGRTFAQVLLEVVPSVGDPRSTESGPTSPAAAIAALPDGHLKQLLQGFVYEARGDAEAMRRSIEAWFDEGMERVSGWYKRRTQALLFLIGCIVAMLLNIDAIAIATQLWREPTLRSAMVTQAQKMVENDVFQRCAAPAAAAASTSGREPLDCAREQLASLPSSLPLGWPVRGWPEAGTTATGNTWMVVLTRVWSIICAVPGWLITGLAVCFGAPFWFDLLGKLVPMRASGSKPSATAATADAPLANAATNGAPTAPSISRDQTPERELSLAEPFRGALNDYEARVLTGSDISEIKALLGVRGAAPESQLMDQATRDAIGERQKAMGFPVTKQLSLVFVNQLRGQP